MTFWRNRRRAKAAQVESEQSKTQAVADLKNALSLMGKAEAQAMETRRVIRENHVQQHLQHTFSRGKPKHGI